MGKRISTRVTVLIGIFGAVAAILLAVAVPVLIEDLIRKNALYDAEHNIEQMKILRRYYTENVVSPINASDKIKPHYAHRNNDAFVPLPATMIHDLSDLYSKDGRSLDIYSKFPFPNRGNRTLDPFQEEAWASLTRDPKSSFSRTETLNGQEVIRVAVSDVMEAETCVGCHNSHPESPKTDWRLGDVRGVLEMQLNLSESLALAQKFGLIIAAIVAAVAVAGSLGLSMFMRRAVLLPMEAISNAARFCAEGDTTVTVLGVERSDEIGTLARSLDVFRKQADEVQKLSAERVKYLAELEDIVDERTRELSNISDTANDAIITINADLEILTWNAAASRIFEYSADDAVGQNIGTIIPEHFLKDQNVGFARVTGETNDQILGSTIELEGLRKSGEKFPLEMTLSTWTGERGRIFSGILRDITERKRAEKELIAKESQLRMALENLPGAMIVVDSDLRVTTVNDTYKDFFGDLDGLVAPGASMREILESEIAQGLLSGDGTPAEILEERINSFKPGSDVTFEDRSPDGRYFHLSRTSAPDDYTVTVAVDVTDRKKAEEAVAAQKAIIDESIKYASRIQRSTLPAQELLNLAFTENFVIWEPRDVVGGDIYWLLPVENGYILGFADCTGHGVPGAFLTLVATSALRFAISENPDAEPAQLIASMNYFVKDVLAQYTDDAISDDGLELGICRIDTKSRSISFSGAKYSLWILTDGQIQEVKGDKTGIGYTNVPIRLNLKDHTINHVEGAGYYMFSDGFTDQIGGERGRGFGKRRLLDQIVQHKDLPMTDQREAILKAFNKYQGDETRRDDLSMVGFRL